MFRFVLHDFNDDDSKNVVPDADPEKRAAVGKIPRHEHGYAYILDQRDGSIEKVAASGESVHVAEKRAYENACDEVDRRAAREADRYRFLPLRKHPAYFTV